MRCRCQLQHTKKSQQKQGRNAFRYDQAFSHSAKLRKVPAQFATLMHKLKINDQNSSFSLFERLLKAAGINFIFKGYAFHKTSAVYPNTSIHFPGNCGTLLCQTLPGATMFWGSVRHVISTAQPVAGGKRSIKRYVHFIMCGGVHINNWRNDFPGSVAGYRPYI